MGVRWVASRVEFLRRSAKVKADIYTEIFLLNKNMDSLVRVLQRMQALGIWSRQEMTAYEVRLEELRASVNADFTGRTAVNERVDRDRFETQRLAVELNHSSAEHAVKQTKQSNQRKH
jgi:hypothetical protein